MKLTLFHFWRSSSSWRVRWALHLKGVPFESVQYDLDKEATDSPDYLKINPMGFVPALQVQENGRTHTLSESMVILQFLNDRFPQQSIFPKDDWMRYRTMQLAQISNAMIQPLANYGVPEFWSQDPEDVKKWCQHWAKKGLAAAETLAKETAGQWLIGDQLSLADLYLVPQCWGAIRKGLDLNHYPTLKRVHDAALKTEACAKSHPESYQPR